MDDDVKRIAKIIAAHSGLASYPNMRLRRTVRGIIGSEEAWELYTKESENIIAELRARPLQCQTPEIGT